MRRHPVLLTVLLLVIGVIAGLALATIGFGGGLRGAAPLAFPAPVLAEPDPADAAAVERGAYVLAAAGCVGCHTAPAEGGAQPVALAGGRALETPFGTFFTPNITPDPATGIGGWSFADFRRALREGRSPSGTPYFPAFPYTAYSGMTERDIADLWAYLQSVAPVERANTPHELPAPFGWRALLPVWRALHFREGPPAAPLGAAPDWYRGAYLVEVLAHCGECHTPRDWMGGLDQSRAFAGNPEAPEGGGAVPNITPHPDGIEGWTVDDIEWFLADGMLPDGDYAGGAMAEVIRRSTSVLTTEDRRAIGSYLLSLPPRPGS